MKEKKRVIFLVWAPYSPRSENLSRRLNANIYLTSYKFKQKIYAPIKYPVLFVKTVRILRNERPDVVVCQTPPIFCALSVLMYNFIYSKKIKVIVDAHTQTFRNPWTYFKALTKMIIRNSYLVLVSNLEIQNKVNSLYGIKALVLEDMIPEFKNHKTSTYYNNKEKTLFNIAVISSFAADEPISSVLESALQLPNIFFYVTGDKSNMPKYLVKKKFANVSFTGFLQYEEYIALLHFVDAIMVLTDREETMLSGAYDAVSSEKPLISFTSEPIRRYFSKGTIYVDNSPAEIKEAIKQVQAKKVSLTEGMRQLKEQRINEWEQKIESFKSLIMDLG
jgi:glycosyltransferase involved in cell wall biosynthesis